MRVEAAGGGGAVAELERAEAHLLGGVAVAVGLALAVEHLVFGRAAPAYHSGLCKGSGERRESGRFRVLSVILYVCNFKFTLHFKIIVIGSSTKLDASTQRKHHFSLFSIAERTWLEIAGNRTA